MSEVRVIANVLIAIFSVSILASIAHMVFSLLVPFGFQLEYMQYIQYTHMVLLPLYVYMVYRMYKWLSHLHWGKSQMSDE